MLFLNILASERFLPFNMSYPGYASIFNNNNNNEIQSVKISYCHHHHHRRTHNKLDGL